MKIKEFLSLLNPLKGIIQKNQKIQNTDQLIIFIKERSAWITQVTLLGYLKTRMGTQYVTAFENKELMQSINYGKEKIYLTSIQDLTLYTISYMKGNNLTDLSEQGENIYSKIIDESKNLPLSQNELFKDIEKFEKRLLDCELD
jgi:tRNA U34 5-carboxymethylaminomethyl modifying GTPase MnmE/TrmE